MAEIRVFHHHRFLCRAICAELAGETIALRGLIQARNRRRRDLRQTLQDRLRTVEALLEAHHGEPAVDEIAVVADPAVTLEANPARVATPRLKRYINGQLPLVSLAHDAHRSPRGDQRVANGHT